MSLNLQPRVSIANVFKQRLKGAVDEFPQRVDGGRGPVQQPAHHAAGVVVVDHQARQTSHQDSRFPGYMEITSK